MFSYYLSRPTLSWRRRRRFSFTCRRQSAFTMPLFTASPDISAMPFITPIRRCREKMEIIYFHHFEPHYAEYATGWCRHYAAAIRMIVSRRRLGFSFSRSSATPSWILRRQSYHWAFIITPFSGFDSRLRELLQLSRHYAFHAIMTFTIDIGSHWAIFSAADH